jgi:2-amino-4-hydroxy-6-hydroxymethyldihydropteridine diphosphokinase
MRQVALYERLALPDVTESTALIALGANLPNGNTPPADTLKFALSALADRGFSLRSISRFFATPCFPAGSGPDYVNAAAAITVPAGLTADDLLAHLLAIEMDFGRERQRRWGMRTLDLDLVAWGDMILPDREGFDQWRCLDPALQAQAAPDRLILPHPRLQDRAFVLVPLADVAPAWRHPVLGITVLQMLQALPEADRRAVVPL